MTYRTRDATDSPLFWMGLFLMLAVAACAGDLLGVVTLISRFLVWFAGVM